MNVARVNHFLAHKQHLLPESRLRDVLQVTRDVVALHATVPTTPHLSLLARIHELQRETLDDLLYEQRSLLRMLCMRATLHVVPTDEIEYFHRAYVERRVRAETRYQQSLLVEAGLCQEAEAHDTLRRLRDRVVDVLTQTGPCTARKISLAVPELVAKVRYAADKPYGGEFSVGSRLIPGMCSLGLLVRSRPRGSWRSNTYEYAALSHWLPDVCIGPDAPQEARAWLVRRYLSAFGPAFFEDVQWWTGFTKEETRQSVGDLSPAIARVAIDGIGPDCLMLADDAQRLRAFEQTAALSVWLLPGLDPYIMGYRDRGRFLAPQHSRKVFDRAGNAIPTVWAGGRVVGAWGQRKDGTVTCGLFDPVDAAERAALATEAGRLERFLDGEFLAPRTRTSFARDLK